MSFPGRSSTPSGAPSSPRKRPLAGSANGLGGRPERRSPARIQRQAAGGDRRRPVGRHGVGERPVVRAAASGQRSDPRLHDASRRGGPGRRGPHGPRVRRRGAPMAPGSLHGRRHPPAHPGAPGARAAQADRPPRAPALGRQSVLRARDRPVSGPRGPGPGRQPLGSGHAQGPAARPRRRAVEADSGDHHRGVPPLPAHRGPGRAGRGTGCGPHRPARSGRRRGHRDPGLGPSPDPPAAGIGALRAALPHPAAPTPR